MANEIVILNPDTQIARVQSASRIIRRLRESTLMDGVHYGTIPGTQKPTLYQAGAEVVMRALNLRARYELLSAREDIDPPEPYFFYKYRCVIVDLSNDDVIGEAIGSANSREKKYRWRNVSEYELAALGLDKSNVHSFESFASEPSYYLLNVDKWRVTATKPLDYWQALYDAHQNRQTVVEHRKGKHGPYQQISIKSTVYRVPNPEVFDLVNTIDKMAQKRAYVSAVKQAAAISEYFTVDLEDMPEFSAAIPPVPILPPPASKPAPGSEPERRIATFVKVRHAVEVDGKPLRFVADSGVVYDVFNTSLLEAAKWDVSRWQTGDRSLVKDGFEIAVAGDVVGETMTLVDVMTQAPPPDPDKAARAVHDKTKERRMETGLNTSEEREAAKAAQAAEEKSSIAPADVTVENLFAFAMQELILDADATIKWMNGNAMSDSQTVVSDWLDMAHGGNLQTAIQAIQSAS